MGMGLRRADEALDVSFETWMYGLWFAALQGWQPLGTVLDEELLRMQMGGRGVADEGALLACMEEWPGTYNTNDWQIVLHDDALALSESLERAAAVVGPTTPVRQPSGYGRRERMDPPEYFGGEAGKRYLLRLADWCRGGDFLIG
jgi:hypothetical protein